MQSMVVGASPIQATATRISISLEVTGLAGLVSWSPVPDAHLSDDLASILSFQHALGAASTVASDGLALGMNTIASKGTDQVNLTHAGLRLAVIARPSPGASPYAEWTRVADCWTAGRCAALSAVGGDWAAVIWSPSERRLWLARSPFSPFAIHWRRTREGAAFASLAPALFAPGDPLDASRIARALAPLDTFDRGVTANAAVRLVPPGSIVELDPQRVTITSFWSARDHQPVRIDDRDAPAALRDALDGAIRRHLASADRPVATLLSGGRDSGAVTARTARILAGQGGHLDAYTAVPNSKLVVPPGHVIVDEGPRAAALARHHPNVRHHRVEGGRIALGALLDRHNAYLASPHESPINLGWWCAILDRVRESGGALLFEATLGNLSLSVGGPWAIPDIRDEDGIIPWLSAMRAAARHPRASWLNLVGISAAPLLPGSLVDRIQRRRHPELDFTPSLFLKGDLAEATQACVAAARATPVPAFRTRMAQWIDHHDPFDPGPAAVHGIDLRDPTSDRGLVETSLAFSARQIASPYDRRPIYDSAFADDLPSETMRPPGLGMQSADWALAFDPEELASSLRRYAARPAVTALIDVEAMIGALGNWPDTPTIAGPAYTLFTHWLRVFSIASWLNQHR